MKVFAKQVMKEVVVSYDGDFIYVRSLNGKLLHSVSVKSHDTWLYREPTEVFEAVKAIYNQEVIK